MSDLRAIMREMTVGASSPPKPDWWKWVGGAVAVFGLIITIATSAISVVSSNQKLLDKIDGMDDRLKVVEAGRAVNIPRLDEQIQANKLQDQRIQNMIDSSSDERKARQASDADARKAQADILALVARLTDRVNDLTTEQAVQRERQRHGALPVPEHDAQATQVPMPRSR
ncbi:MAG: hypothetical protein ACRYGP_16965 [Janthinobacterium lividum]